MSFTLVFLAILMSAVVWWLVKQTVNLTPWTASASTDSVRSDGVRYGADTTPLPSIKVALGVFLAVVTSLFALFISAYAIRMEYGDWRPLPEPALLWVNSGILVMSSVFLQMAWSAAKRENLATVRFGVAGGGALALAFIIGQLMAWNQLSSSGYLISTNPANAFFYVLTALHALHLAGGLIALGKTVKRVWRSDDMGKIRLGVELCAVYWHYLLAIWVILFGFMLST
jgi:cytochrome c oxidase subunit 3